MNVTVEEDDGNYSIYECLYSKNYPGWSEKLEEHKSAILQLSNLIERKEKEHGEFYPLRENVFKALEMTPLDKVKVVIWGQDPYPTLLPSGKPRAQGYSFGVDRRDQVPQSLRNIYKEIADNFSSFEAPNHGDLTWLSNQGILLMNQSLTYCPANPKLYLNLWNRFTYIIIKILNENVEGCIHLLWGKQCEPLIEHIRSREIHQASHPSPFSARRGFFGCKHFLKANIILENRKKAKIEELVKLLNDKKIKGEERENLEKELEEVKEKQVQINWNENQKLVPTYLENI